MAYETIIKKYLSNLQQEYRDALADNQHTAELSFRVPLDTLFKDLAVELNGNSNIVVILEPRNQAGMGRPDWRIHDRSTLGVYGYIEGKGLTPDSFDIRPYEAQFNRYLSLGHKLIITDGIDFVYSFDRDVRPQIVSLIDKSLMDKPDWSRCIPNPQFKDMMERFFSEPSPQYCDEGQLVELVAIRTRILSDEIIQFSKIKFDEAMDDIERNAISLLSGLRELVYNHNDPTLRNDQVFADYVAQVIMFTLLFAHRIKCSDTDTPIEKERKIREYLSQEISTRQTLRPFLTIMQYLNAPENSGSFILAWTDECIRFLSFVHMTDQQRQRPDYHRLFELFFSKFDARARFDYGAYYTPSELAGCIVKLAEEIAQHVFHSSIFSDRNVIVDPCCGTGSFLEQVRINDTRHGAFTLCGIEILPAPYMLANYRMAMLDVELGEYCSHNEVLLANTLSNCLFGETANIDTVEGYELHRACEITSRPITLVIGNPPSSDSAKTNDGEDFSIIRSLMDDFRPPVESRHGRQNTQKQINNPHMQFLRWGCEKLQTANTDAILAYIVPLSLLENDSYKFARKYIIEHFSEIWVVSVDADARSGIRSDSLFKTQQGRAILIATRSYEETNHITKFHYFDISHLSQDEKIIWLEQDSSKSIKKFTEHNVDETNYGFCPAAPFNQDLYASFWPISGEREPNRIFMQHCSGIKLAPTSIFTHIKAPMLKRRSKDIVQRGIVAAEDWMSNQDKPPKNEEVEFFARQLSEYGDANAVDALLNSNIVDYAFRPFLPVKAFLWQDLLQRFSHVGGGGTRRRPEISRAFSKQNTMGFAISHSPKDQKDTLKQFASFCWYYPDNDLCRRGNSYIYLNQYPTSRAPDAMIKNNVNPKLMTPLKMLLNTTEEKVATDVVFYTYAILCSQVYLDEFEGALYTVNRADMRPRIPFVKDANVFRQLTALGEKLAQLERQDYQPENHMQFDIAAIQAQIPVGFRLKHTEQPFDEENEIFVLSDGTVSIEIPCPLEIQRINIAGYDILKNVWLKFNSYDFTHCPFAGDDLLGLLNLINKLVEYVDLVGDIDIIMHEVIEGKYPLILPSRN
jgi:type I restriction-modification system DNA methylase subunit